MSAVFELREWLPWIDAAEAILDVEQRERALRQRREVNRQELILSYALHRLVIGATLGVPATEVPLSRDEQGCPRIDGVPAFTSLSHAGGRAAVAVARSGPVGIDMEPTSRSGEMDAIAHLVGSSEELDGLKPLPASRQASELLATWVRKEAYLKAEGVGLAREMREFSAVEGGAVPSLERPGESLQVRTFDIGPAWILGIAAPPGCRVQVLQVSPR